VKMEAIGTFTRGLAASVLVAAALAVQADDTEKKAKGYTKGPVDKETCIQEAAKMNMATEKLAQLASQKAQNAELKEFAQTLQQEHQKAHKELEKIAQTHNVTLPTTLDQKCQEEITRLEGLSGQEFDREFAKGAVEGHAIAVAHMQHASSTVKEPDLRQYTQTQLSKVRDHQREARKIAQAVGIDQTTITSLERKAQESVGGPASSETSSETIKSDDPAKSDSNSTDTESKIDK
jgi:putative membrane protein